MWSDHHQRPAAETWQEATCLPHATQCLSQCTAAPTGESKRRPADAAGYQGAKMNRNEWSRHDNGVSTAATTQAAPDAVALTVHAEPQSHFEQEVVQRLRLRPYTPCKAEGSVRWFALAALDFHTFGMTSSESNEGWLRELVVAIRDITNFQNRRLDL